MEIASVLGDKFSSRELNPTKQNARGACRLFSKPYLHVYASPSAYRYIESDAGSGYNTLMYQSNPHLLKLAFRHSPSGLFVTTNSDSAMLKYFSIGSICSKSRTLPHNGFPKSPIYSAIFVQLMIAFWLLVASANEFAGRNKKIACTNIFHERARCSRVLSRFKKLRVVEVRHLLHMSSDSFLKCVVKNKLFLWSLSVLKSKKN